MLADLIVRTLTRLPIFEGLSLAQLNEIGRRAEHVIYHPGAMIIEENAEGDAAVIILSGEAVRVSGPELSSRLEPILVGSLLGESAMLIDATAFGSTVVARGYVRALHIRRDELHAQMANDPAVAERLVRNMTKRLFGLAEQLRQVDALLAAGKESPQAPPSTAGVNAPPAPAPVH